MKINESYLEPSKVIIQILDNIKILEQKIEINLNIEDYVSIDESQLEEGSVFLDINNKRLSKDISQITAEVQDNQEKSIELLKMIVITNFEEKLELFQLFKNSDPNLEFPISDWYDNIYFENGMQYIKLFDLNLNRYSSDSFKLHQKSIIKYILRSNEYKNEVKKITVGESDGFNILDEAVNDIKNLPWFIYNKKKDKKESVSFFEMMKSEFGFPLDELKRYFFLKEFAKKPFSIDSPELLKLSKIFDQSIPYMFLNEVKKMSGFDYNHFFMTKRLSNIKKLDSNNAKRIIKESIVEHFLNIKRVFPEYKDTIISIDDITKILLTQLEKTTKENIPNNVKAVILEEIKLEIMIPVKNQESVIKKIKF